MGSANPRFEVLKTQAEQIKWESIQADGLIVPVFKPVSKTDEKSAKNKKAEKTGLVLTPALSKLDQLLLGMIKTTSADEKFDGAKGKVISFRQTPGFGVKARRIILVGLGEAHKLTAAEFDKAIQKAVAPVLALAEFSTIAVVLPERSEKLTADLALKTTIDAIYQATYKSEESKEKPPALKKVSLYAADTIAAQLLQQGERVAQARSVCKDMVNRPANLKLTTTLTDKAKSLAKLPGIKVSVQSNVKWIEKNMPCFFAVARGSLVSDPPKFIEVSYQPSGPVKKKIALVGKSVIFDTGGYQVKTGNYMNTMKGDMTGGAVMLATMEALAHLKPAGIAVTAYMAATPNKIDSDAMIPDSIFETTCGKKVEMRHTDAEGRLTLIDAVAMAAKASPDELITMATLTGSASQAVGCTIALMGRDDALVNRIKEAGQRHGDPIQVLDVTEEDYANIKSKLDGADIINTNHGKGRGAQTAAAFVMSGAPESIPMAHMDIAGADMTPDEKATGIGQKTMLYYLLEESARLASQPAKPRQGSGKASGKKASRSTRKTSGK